MTEIKTRCEVELEKAYKRRDKEAVRLLTYILHGATYGPTLRTYRPMVRHIFKGEGK